jgi:phosphate transport system substrate-binding protein
MRRVVSRALFVALVAIGTVAIAFPVLPAAAATPISGGGSGFAALEIEQWRADTARAPFNLSVNYVAQGSSFGRQQFIDGNLDYGVSDIVFQAAEMPTLKARRCQGRDPGNCFAYVPVSAGGLAFMYNLVDSQGHRITDLKLTRRAACGIFTGAIKKWNDPQITQTNPNLNNGNDIIPIIRADGAGESYVLSDFCRTVAPDIWQAFIADRQAHDPGNVSDELKAGQPVSNWPQQWGRAVPLLAADGVANAVADPVAGANAITYVAAGYAKVRSFPVASLQNAANVYTQPDEDNVTVALGYASPNPDPAAVGTFILNYQGPDQRAYFPSTYSYVIAQTTGFDAGKGATLGQFLCYAISKGQVIAPQLRYARLSQPLVNIAINAISKIPGAPAASSCFLAGAPPPPAAPSVAGGSGGGAAGPTATGGTGIGGTGTTGTGTSGTGSGAVNCDPTASGSGTTGSSTPSTTTTVPAAGGASTTTTTAGAAASATTTTTAACDLTDALTSGSGGNLSGLLASQSGGGSDTDPSDASVVWLLLIGAAVGWGLSTLLRLRRAQG